MLIEGVEEPWNQQVLPDVDHQGLLNLVRPGGHSWSDVSRYDVLVGLSPSQKGGEGFRLSWIIRMSDQLMMRGSGISPSVKKIRWSMNERYRDEPNKTG